MADRFPPQQQPMQDPANTGGTAAPSVTRASPFASGLQGSGVHVVLAQATRCALLRRNCPRRWSRSVIYRRRWPARHPIPRRHSLATDLLPRQTLPAIYLDKPHHQQTNLRPTFSGKPHPRLPSGIDPAPTHLAVLLDRFRCSKRTMKYRAGWWNIACRVIRSGFCAKAIKPAGQLRKLVSQPRKSVDVGFPQPVSAFVAGFLAEPTPSPFTKSLPPPSHPRPNQQYVPYQQQQQSSSRPFGQAPPPAAPFLGYADNTRSQSFRVPSAPASTPGSLFPDARKAASRQDRFLLQTSTSAVSPQITLEAPSSDELVDEFLKMPVDEPSLDLRMGPSPSKLLLADIPDTVEGLKALYVQKRWKSLTKKSLSMLQNPPKDINVTLEIKSWWLAGLIKEGHYDNAASVLDQIGNLDEISIAGGGTPFVPIRLLLLQALLSKCQGKSVNHEKQLFHLIMRLRGAIQQNETIALLDVDLKVAARWLRIAQFALANHLVHQQKFMLALRICSQIDVHSLEDQERIVVLSRVGRIRLQMGDLTAAEKLFEAARYHTSQLKTESGNGTGVTAEVLAELEARLLLNDGLLFFAQNKLQEALSAFDSILYLQNTQIATIENSDAELFLEEDVVCSAVNNYAICALYCCDVKAAVAALERMIRSNPMRFLNGVVVFNLSSLYDLLFDNATSKSRKEMMKKIAHLYDLEHVDPATYRI
ncbi:Tetratricopeptide repeat [Phytophthora cactorum]|nr:Tetratricopeptide repeat [Phytophthora cactorum]